LANEAVFHSATITGKDTSQLAEEKRKLLAKQISMLSARFALFSRANIIWINHNRNRREERLI